MRPIKLSMTAFGPFVKTETVDFEVFGDKPLFLINGATGSGKTTILDAICFALYGQTTGKEREAAQMRCDYADDKILTEVEFTFELGGDQYRIARIPEQLRAKAKGEGTTKQAAKAELWQLKGNKEDLLVPRKVSEATQRIEELTGLQVDQFRQVMVLPQGQFRRLLMADSKDREQIFSQLFETHVYKRIEDKLKALSKNIYVKVQKLKENQQGILQSVAFDSMSELNQSIKKLAQACEAAQRDKKNKESIYLQEVKSLEAAQLLAKDFERLNQQKERFKILEQQEDIFNAKKKEQKNAELAQKIEPLFTELSRCKTEYKRVSAKLEQADKAYVMAQTSLKCATEALKKNKKHIAQLDGQKKELTTLQGYRERAVKLKKFRSELKNTQMQFQVGSKQLEKVKKDLDKSTHAYEKSEADKKLLEQTLQKTENSRTEYQKLSEQLNQKQHYDGLLLKKDQAQKDFQQVIERGKLLASDLKLKQQRAKEVEFFWHNGQAAILAKQLEQHQPCPVCGSLEHPRAAHATHEIPTRQERETAQEDIEKIQVLVQEERDKYTQLKSQLESFNEQMAEQQQRLGDLVKAPLDELKKNHAFLATQMKQQQEQRQKLEKLKIAMSGLKQQEQIARKKLEEVTQAQADINASLQANKALVESAEKELPAPYRDSGQLEKAVLQSEQDITALELMIQQVHQEHIETTKVNAEAKATEQSAREAQKKSQSNKELAKGQWQKAIKKSSFKNDDSYQQAHCDEDYLKSLKLEISDYDNNCQQAQGALKDQQKSLKNKQQPDVTSLQLQLQQAAKEKDQSDNHWKQLDTQLSHFTQAQNTLLAITKKQQVEEDEYKTIGTLSNVANGMTGNKISLQRFVLGVLLDDVLIEASHRLKVMSKGRYLLLRKEDRAKGNKASGLELEVEDSYTGKVRAVSTLSGGEAFMASLSLALGLSDVVQAYAGGIRLDTLFIDEGFGSLDADSLDLAIRTLIDLRDTGRMVGIISHVSELKEQISLRLDVVSGRSGSTIQLIH